jgi:hypothetical protein
LDLSRPLSLSLSLSSASPFLCAWLLTGLSLLKPVYSRPAFPSFPPPSTIGSGITKVHDKNAVRHSCSYKKLCLAIFPNDNCNVIYATINSTYLYIVVDETTTMFISHMCCKPSWHFVWEKTPPHSLVVHVLRVVLLLNSQIVSPSQIRVFVIKEVWSLFFSSVFECSFCEVMRFLIISTSQNFTPRKKKKACSSQSCDVHLSVCKEASTQRQEHERLLLPVFLLLVRSNPLSANPLQILSNFSANNTQQTHNPNLLNLVFTHTNPPPKSSQNVVPPTHKPTTQLFSF